MFVAITQVHIAMAANRDLPSHAPKVQACHYEIMHHSPNDIDKLHIQSHPELGSCITKLRQDRRADIPTCTDIGGISTATFSFQIGDRGSYSLLAPAWRSVDAHTYRGSCK
jgi:hypothetical protein